MLVKQNSRVKKIVALIVSLGLLITLLGANKVSAGSEYVHFEFRVGNPEDISWSQYKYTTSAYYLRSGSINKINDYTATPCGKNGGVARAVGPSVKINRNKTYYLTNYLVEWYGKGNAAWIHARKNANGSAYGTWYADH